MPDVQLLIGTPKGAFILDSDPQRADWALRGPLCEGWPIHDLIVEPSSGEIRRGAKKDYPKIAPFDSEKNYRAAIKEEGGEVPKEGLRAA